VFVMNVTRKLILRLIRVGFMGKNNLEV